ncbi:MAG TPA: hypothetical protein DCP90_05295 [Clostridiales bacterium]|nr:MAG: hypothetical protein A2Y22_08910 [Clostridiales bacterium GWD2_32_59]HAN10015.1 hypothetical protein [Clostridiales bacterium]
MQHRNDLRAHCNIIVKMAKALDYPREQVMEKDKFNVEISDISATGIHFITDEKIEEGKRYIIELQINQTIEIIICKIIRVSSENKMHKCGAKFEKMPYNTEKNLRAYVYKWQLDKCRQ